MLILMLNNPPRTLKNIDRTRNGECIERDSGKAVAKRRGLGGVGGRCHGWPGAVEPLSSKKSRAGASRLRGLVTVDGVRLHSVASGGRRPVVFLHGKVGTEP